MNKAFYLRLAFDNLKKNAKMYVPYLLTSILTTMMYYMVVSLASNPNLSMMLGGDSIASMLGFGSIVISIFSIIFLFYTNSFLIKRRKKEFGLFNILGMEKKHLARVIAYESIFSLILSLIFGIGIGILSDKAFYLLITRMLDAEIVLGFYVSTQGIMQATILFTFIYILIYIFSLIQINLLNPIELLNSDKTGEKEPKTKWSMTILGVICLGSGYYMAVSIQDPISAFAFFFVAVVLVILGTYFLFTAGSIAVLKLLRKNKTYYYKTNHFISVSNMMYRMKQNAVGLANICILSTMVLVMLSTTISLWVGIDDAILQQYPREIVLRDRDFRHEEISSSIDELTEAVNKADVKAENVLAYRSLYFAALRENDAFEIRPFSANISDISNIVTLYFIPLEDFNKNEGTNITLDEGEVLIHPERTTYDSDTFSIMEENFKVKDQIEKMNLDGAYAANIQSSIFVIVDSLDTLFKIDAIQQAAYKENASFIETLYGFDLPQNDYQNVEVVAKSVLSQLPEKEDGNWTISSTRQANLKTMISLYAGFLFIGIFLSFLFIMATILIMYYKQITEGYQDKKRFEIMQKVGLEKREVKKTINSQVLTVFFLPLVVAAIHIAFAYPMIEKLMKLLYMTNSTLYITTTIVCFAVFALIYILIYSLTAKTYYGIVQRD